MFFFVAVVVCLMVLLFNANCVGVLFVVFVVRVCYCSVIVCDSDLFLFLFSAQLICAWRLSRMVFPLHESCSDSLRMLFCGVVVSFVRA